MTEAEMAVTPEDVRNKRFSQTKFKPGYVEEEVDGFLDEVEKTLTFLVTKLNEKSETPITAGAVTALNTTDQQALNLLAMAQQTANQTVAAAEVEARKIIGNAEEEHHRVIDGLDQERGTLERQLDMLRSAETLYRLKIRDAAEELLSAVTAQATL